MNILNEYEMKTWMENFVYAFNRASPEVKNRVIDYIDNPSCIGCAMNTPNVRVRANELMYCDICWESYCSKNHICKQCGREL